jgi:hypothetical protein
MTWEPFDRYAERYDRWFDEEPGRSIFPFEVAAIRLVLKDTSGPRLEVTASASTLVQPPDTAGFVAEQPSHGLARGASFVCLRAELG